VTRQEYEAKFKQEWYSGKRCGKLMAVTKIRDEYIASLEAENKQLREENQKLVEQINKEGR